MLVSVHIPKTAGTSFKQYLHEIFGENLCTQYFGMQKIEDPNWRSPRYFIGRQITSLKGLRVHRPWTRQTDEAVHGHFLATKHLKKFPDARLITWVRDPLERIASHYHFFTHFRDPGNSLSIQIQEGMSLLEFAEVEGMQNLQTRYLNGVPLERFSFVGLTEEFEEQLPLCAHTLGLPVLPAPTKNTNPNKKFGAKYNLTAAEREKLHSLNQDDLQLYTAVQNLHQTIL